MSRGSTALPAALAALAVSAALGAAIAELTRIEVAIARHRRAATAALVATDACVAEVIAGLAPAWDFGDVLAGADGAPGTADDGVLAAPPGCTANAARPPGPAAPPRALLRLEARAGGGRRLVEALVGHDPAPAVPALLWLGAPPPAGAITGSVTFDGADADDPSAADWSGLAAPDDPALLDLWLAGEGAGVAASGRTAPAMSAAPPPFVALRDRIRGAEPAGAEALVAGASPPPSIALVDGDLTIPGALHGAGVLLVEGSLDIQGSLDFTGIVIATGGLRVERGGSLAVSGALWTGVPLTVDGTVALRHSGGAVATADGLLPLPRRAILLGQRDLG
jgi:hypothetical protein